MTSGVLVRFTLFEPSAPITQMSVHGCPEQCSLDSALGRTKTILPWGDVWADAVAGSRTPTHHRTAIETPDAVIACLGPVVRTNRRMIPFPAVRHHAQADRPRPLRQGIRRAPGKRSDPDGTDLEDVAFLSR